MISFKKGLLFGAGLILPLAILLAFVYIVIGAEPPGTEPIMAGTEISYYKYDIESGLEEMYGENCIKSISVGKFVESGNLLLKKGDKDITEPVIKEGIKIILTTDLSSNEVIALDDKMGSLGLKRYEEN